MTRVGGQTVNPLLWDIVGMKNQISERLSNRYNGSAFTGVHGSSKADVNAAMNLKQLAVGQAASRRKSKGFCEGNGTPQKTLPSATFATGALFRRGLLFR